MTEIPRLNDPAADLARIAQAAGEAMTDGMVERMATTAANGLEVLDRLNDEDTREALLAALDGLTQLHKSGALGTLLELVTVLHAARNAVDDHIVDRLFGFVEHMANNFATEDLATLAHEAKGALEDALEVCGTPQAPKGGLLATVRMLWQPETQQALQFMLAFSCKMRQRANVLAKTPSR